MPKHLFTHLSSDAHRPASHGADAVEQRKRRSAAGRKGSVVGILANSLLAIDSSFTPVKKVNFEVQNTRVQQITDYDKLILEVWTDGTVTPQEATSQGAKILMDHLRLITELPDFVVEEKADEQEPQSQENALLQKPIEDLDLTLRSYNCLKRSDIHTLGDIVSIPADVLAKIRNFGKKSYAEVEEKVQSFGLQLNHSQDNE